MTSDTLIGRSALQHPLVIVSSLGISGVLLLTIVFYSGAAYNRMDSMEKHLVSIDEQIAKLGDVASFTHRIEKLEQENVDMREELAQHDFYLKSDVPMPKRKAQ